MIKGKTNYHLKKTRKYIIGEIELAQDFNNQFKTALNDILKSEQKFIQF